MTKLEQVRKALQENPDIVIVGAPEFNYLPGRSSYWSHTVDFYLAPRNTGVYEAKELQSMMKSLIPELTPTTVDDFRDGGKGGSLSFGKLYFDEEIGTETVRRELVLSDLTIAPDNFVEGKLVIDGTEAIRRRTWVRLYPNILIAAEALQDKNQYSISKEELAKSRKSLTH